MSGFPRWLFSQGKGTVRRVQATKSQLSSLVALLSLALPPGLASPTSINPCVRSAARAWARLGGSDLVWLWAQLCAIQDLGTVELTRHENPGLRTCLWVSVFL